MPTPKLPACAGCKTPSRTEYCDRCAPPPEGLGRGRDERCPDRRWNGSSFHAVRPLTETPVARAALGGR